MVFEGIFIIELLFLFFTSSIVYQSLFMTCYRFTKSKNLSITFLSLIFFPGVLIHELSHMLMASILFVPVGEMELVPQLEGEYLKMGSVKVAQTDFLRRFLIGVAPVILGGGLLLFIVFYFTSIFSIQQIFSGFQGVIYALLLYVSFVIANTMFSSKKDMEGTLGLLFIAFIVTFGILFAGGKNLEQSLIQWLNTPSLTSGFYYSALLLLVPVVINGIFLLLWSVRKS